MGRSDNVQCFYCKREFTVGDTSSPLPTHYNLFTAPCVGSRIRGVVINDEPAHSPADMDMGFTTNVTTEFQTAGAA